MHSFPEAYIKPGGVNPKGQTLQIHLKHSNHSANYVIALFLPPARPSAAKISRSEEKPDILGS